MSLLGGSLVFDRPAWLLLVLVAPVVSFAALRWSLADFPRRQLAAQAVVRALVLAGVAIALAGPSLRRAGKVAVVALVDVSDSVADPALEIARKAVAELARAADAHGSPPPRLVRFAAAPEELIPPGTTPDELARALTRFPRPGSAATDLALAGGFGAGLFDGAFVPRLLFISDGRPTRGDLPSLAERLRQRRLPIYVHPLPPPAGGDAAVIELVAPEDVRPNAPFNVDVHLLADRKLGARLHLQGEAGVSIEDPDRALTLEPGTRTVTFTARIAEAGETTLRARLSPEGGDRHAENDEGVVVIATEREPRVLCLEGTPGAAAAFARALGRERIGADVRATRAFPSRSELGQYDLVALADVPRSQLADASLAALDQFVRNGGGLLVAGGTQSFGPGGYAETKLEDLLPVRLDPPARREEATLALALVIDKSGSMSGAKMDLTKEAARSTAETLPPGDQIAVVAFDSQATAVVRLQRAANRLRILTDIARIQPSGGTNILAGLREGVDELLVARARKKHVILLSDGQSPYDEIPDLVDAAANARITISAIGVGDGADQTLLKMIASRGGGRFYHARDPASIPRIFSRETSELGNPSIVERATAVQVAKRVAALAGVPLETAPSLGGYVLTRPRARAEMVLAAGDGSPLYARWQIGLGQVAAWTSDLGSRWGGAWTRWPPHEKLWSQIARATMRRRAATHFPIRTARMGDTVRLTIDAVGPDDRFMTGLRGEIEVSGVDPAGTPTARRSLPIAETAPGHYEASFRPEIEAGALLFRTVLEADGVPAADASGRITLPFAPELRPHLPAASKVAPEGPALLAAVAGETGGRVIAQASDVGQIFDLAPELHRDSRETRQPLQTPVLLVTLALFLLDILARRIRWPPRRADH